MHALLALLAPDGLLPRGQSLAWNPGLVWLHALADGLIALACLAIAFELLRRGRQRRGAPHPLLHPLVGLFLLVCGAAHAFEVWTIWHGDHHVSGGLKAVTAVLALAAAFVLHQPTPAAAPPAFVEAAQVVHASLDERSRDKAEITRLNHLLQRRVDELQALFNVLPVGVGIAEDRECRVIRTNEALARMLGVDRKTNASMSAVARTAPLGFRVCHNEQTLTPDQLPMQTSARENRAVTDFEETIIRGDGTRIEVLANAVPLRDPHGNVAGCVATFQDVTALKTALAAHARYTAIVASSQEAIIGNTLDGIITEWNAAAEEIFGYSAAEMIGHPVTRLLPDDRREEETAKLAHAARGEPVPGFETLRRHKDGRLVDVSIVMSPIRNPAGRIVGVSASARDISARKQAEAQRREMDRKLQETQKLESLGVLAGGIAHDFNNLLAGILGNASLARAELPASSEIALYLQQIDTAARRAADLCRQMPAYSGRSLFLVQRLDLNALVRDLHPLLNVSLGQHCTLQLDLATSLPPVLADASQLRQVVMNLVTNAAEAIGQRPGRVNLATGVVSLDRGAVPTLTHEYGIVPGEHVFLEVSDTGAGMDAATLEKIFDPFFSTKFTGRGLGLAAVLGIVRGHKGAIKVASAPEQGSTFTIYLPRAASHAA